ncbi:MAG: ribonuclease HI [Bacteroidia bacterium]
MEKPIILYTDGASTGNPGPGGFGAVLIYNHHRKEISAGFRKTTNNRMELLAVIQGLRAIKKPGATVHIYSDSKYVVDAIDKGWVFGWEKKYFKDKKNPDLWKQFLELYKMFKIKMFWVRGHAGNVENERCDVLATTAARNHEFIDVEYEKTC